MPPSTISRRKPISNGIKNLSEGISCWEMSQDVIRDFDALVTGELPSGSLIVSVFSAWPLWLRISGICYDPF